MAFPVGTWNVKAGGVAETLTIDSMNEQNGFFSGYITETSGRGAPIAGIYSADIASIEFIWPYYSSFTYVYIFKGNLEGTSFVGNYWVSHIPAEPADIGKDPGSWTASQT